MKLKIYDIECHIRDDVKLPSDFDSMGEDVKFLNIIVKNLLHRIEGPAIIYSDGTKKWYLNGKHHRIDGSATIWSNGTKEWYLNDIRVDGEIYEKIQSSSMEELLVYMKRFRVVLWRNYWYI